MVAIAVADGDAGRSRREVQVIRTRAAVVHPGNGTVPNVIPGGFFQLTFTHGGLSDVDPETPSLTTRTWCGEPICWLTRR